MLPWAQEHKEAFERDVLLDFCGASDLLFEQFARHKTTGAVSFPVLREMVGEPMNKGLLWRLKDKAHHVFPKGPDADGAGMLLDWALGSIFHETLKLMEDAHQRQFYAPQLDDIRTAPSLSPEAAKEADALRAIQEGTGESIANAIQRLDALLARSRALFRLYFRGRRGHRPLARFLCDSNALARRAFGGEYAAFIIAIYDEEPEYMFLEAARSYRESAREQDAEAALCAALALNPDLAEAAALRGERGR